MFPHLFHLIEERHGGHARMLFYIADKVRLIRIVLMCYLAEIYFWLDKFMINGRPKFTNSFVLLWRTNRKEFEPLKEGFSIELQLTRHLTNGIIEIIFYQLAGALKHGVHICLQQRKKVLI